MSATRYRIVDSPIGPLTLRGDAEVLTGLSMQDQRHAPVVEADVRQNESAFPDVVEQLTAYFACELTQFDVNLRLEGTGFQLRVWSALQEIPYGETMSYGELAKRIGEPAAFRAVGLANGRNPVAIIVPCHRVIGASGALVGYGGGLDRKRLLLDLERSHAEPHLGGLGLVLGAPTRPDAA
jgi:methylated-DNA-[protein]-cysteine S-methyltransferase